MYNYVASLGSCVEPYLTGKFFTNFPNSLSKKLTQKVAYAAQLISKPAVLMKIVMMESGVLHLHILPSLLDLN